MSSIRIPFLFLLSYALGQDVLKAMPLGRPQPVTTLIAPASRSSNDFNPTPPNNSSSSYEDPEERHATLTEERNEHLHSLSEAASIDLASADELVGDHFDLYVPYDDMNEMTLVKPGLTRRATFRGTMMMDCKRSLEACQNACWYQNCVKGARGDPSRAPYTYMYSAENKVNRVQAGVTVS